MSDAERIAELEAKLAFAEDQIEDINRAIYAQQRQIDLLQAQFRLLYRQFRDAKAELSGGARDSDEEVPPRD